MCPYMNTWHNLFVINSVNPGSKLNFSSFLFYTSISKQLREGGGAELEKTESWGGERQSWLTPKIRIFFSQQSSLRNFPVLLMDYSIIWIEKLKMQKFLIKIFQMDFFFGCLCNSYYRVLSFGIWVFKFWTWVFK